MRFYLSQRISYVGMASYKLSDQAKEDLIRIHQYGILTFGEEQADKYLADFFDQFEIIAQNPGRYQKVDFIRTDYRRCICGVDSIFYRVKDGIVEIMAIIGRQNLGKIFD